MKKLIIIGLTIMIFFFKNIAMANYEKVLYDFQIESINGEIINFKEYENKTGKKVGCIEEIALSLNYINKSQMLKIANSMIKSSYGKYLLDILNK